MIGLDRAAAADALAGAYGKITQFAGGLTEADAMLGILTRALTLIRPACKSLRMLAG